MVVVVRKLGTGGGNSAGGTYGSRSGKKSGSAASATSGSSVCSASPDCSDCSDIVLLRRLSTCLRIFEPDCNSTSYERGPVTLVTVPGNHFGSESVKFSA